MSESTPRPSVVPTEPDLSGRRLGDFQLLRRLGRGAMAEVYLAEQLSLRRQVAVKVLKSELARDTTYVQRFHNEAQAAAGLVHANIVQIHDVGCVDGVHYIAQEYVQGANLAEWMTRHGPPELPMALAVMRQVAAALVRASDQSIVHRDIKPENIMLARSGEVKVADFGLARAMAGGAASDLTQVGVTMGTPLYMSPEQVEGRPLDPRSDIYSLGVTCYQMLSGVTPFRGETALAVAVQHLKTEPERLERQRPDLPPALCRIVHTMLAKAPERRYPSARELLRELRSLQLGLDDAPWEADDSQWSDAELATLANRQQATQRLAAVMRSTRALERPRRRRHLLMAALVVVAAGVGGAIAWASREPDLLAGAADNGAELAPSAADQRQVARMTRWEDGREALLLSVNEQNYPQPSDRPTVDLARLDLAINYMMHDRLDEAQALFQQVSAVDNKSLQASGLTGLAFVHVRRDAFADAQIALAKLRPLLSEGVEIDPILGPRLQYTWRKLREAGRDIAAEERKFFDQWESGLDRMPPGQRPPERQTE